MAKIVPDARRAEPRPRYSIGIVAALPRELADHADRFYAVHDADDVVLAGNGIVFRFSGEAGRDRFVARTRRHSKADLLTRLAATRI